MAAPLAGRRKLVVGAWTGTTCRMAASITVQEQIVGDGGCGKTTLLQVFARGRGTFTEETERATAPTISESESVTVADIQLPDGRRVELSLCDLPADGRQRALRYPQTDVLLLCFALDDRASFASVSEKWLPELMHYIPTVPRLLVGCKSDLVSRPEAEAEAEAHALAYVECSAKTGAGVHDVFLRAAIASMSAVATRHTYPLCVVL